MPLVRFINRIYLFNVNDRILALKNSSYQRTIITQKEINVFHETFQLTNNQLTKKKKKLSNFYTFN